MILQGFINRIEHLNKKTKLSPFEMLALASLYDDQNFSQ